MKWIYGENEWIDRNMQWIYTCSYALNPKCLSMMCSKSLAKTNGTLSLLTPNFTCAIQVHIL